MPKTQSALLEAMAEHQVTVDGATRILPQPFLVMATENPIEYEGTFPLPEAQLDRFFLRTALGYPQADDELKILHEQRHGHPLGHLRAPSDLEEIEELRVAAQDVYVAPVIQRWIVDLVRATREVEDVSIGASVRGSLALERAVRAWALLHGRSYVVPEDVERLFTRARTPRRVPARVPRRGAEDRLGRGGRRFPRALPRRAPRPQPEDVDLTVVPG